MPNFCPNCGAKMSGKFCSSCGIEAKDSLIGHWQAKEIDNTDGGHNIKGTLTLLNDYLVFFSYAFISGNPKERRRIPVSGIKSIIRTPILNIISIKYNKAPEGSSWFKRFINGRTVSYKITDYQSLIENIKKLNPNIKT